MFCTVQALVLDPNHYFYLLLFGVSTIVPSSICRLSVLYSNADFRCLPDLHAILGRKHNIRKFFNGNIYSELLSPSETPIVVNMFRKLLENSSLLVYGLEHFVEFFDQSNNEIHLFSTASGSEYKVGCPWSKFR